MKRIDFEKHRRIDNAFIIIAAILWGLSLLWLSSCKKPEEDRKPVDTCMFTSVSKSEVLKYRYLYGMRGAENMQGKRPYVLVYSSTSFNLNVEYMAPLNKFDSIVKQ